MYGRFIQRDAVKLLLRFIQLLDKNHDTGLVGPYYDWSQYIPDLDELYNSERRQATRLQILQTLHDSFVALAEHAKQEIEAAKTNVTLYANSSIYSLPDELISQILLESQAITQQTDEQSDFALPSASQPELVYSHVSRRFRSIALGTRSLWSRVQLRFPLSLIDTYLDRSDNAPLCIVFGGINCDKTGDDFIVEMKVRKEHYVAKILTSSLRWNSIHFHFLRDGNTSGHTASFEDFMSVGKHHVPMLREIHYTKASTNNFIHNLPSTSELISQQLMAHDVQHCRCANWLPELKDAARLRSFAFSATKPSPFPQYTTLFTVISNMHNLVTLNLYITIPNVVGLLQEPRFIVTFPSLKMLVVKFGSEVANWSFKKWRYPVIQRLEYSSRADVEKNDDIYCLLSNREPMLELTTFECSVASRKCAPSELIGVLSGVAPNIRHIALSQLHHLDDCFVPDLTQFDEDVDPWLEQLRLLSRVSLQNSDWITNRAVLEYIRQLHMTGSWGDFTMMELINCRGIDVALLYEEIGQWFPQPEDVRAKLRTYEGIMTSGWHYEALTEKGH